MFMAIQVNNYIFCWLYVMLPPFVPLYFSSRFPFARVKLRPPVIRLAILLWKVITIEAEVHNEPIVSPTPRPNRPKRLREPNPKS